MAVIKPRQTPPREHRTISSDQVRTTRTRMREVFLRWRGARFPIREAELLIGRNSSCHIVIANPSASREHAVVYRHDGEMFVKDLRSRNRTRVNGQPIKDVHKLKAGDAIHIGTESLVVEVAGEDDLAQTDQSTIDSEEELKQTTGVRHPSDRLPLVEALMDSPRKPEPTLITQITVAIDAEAEQARLVGISPERAMRVAHVAQIVASWFPNRSMDAWRDRILRDLGI